MFNRIRIFLFLLAILCIASPSEAQNSKPLTNADIIAMVKEKVKEVTILKAIETNEEAFDVSAEALIALKKAHVKETIVHAMQDMHRQNQLKLRVSQDAGAPSRATAPEKTPANDVEKKMEATGPAPATPGRNGISYPKCVQCPPPSYSQEALAEKISGTVMIQIVVRADGQAEIIKIVKSLGHGLDERAMTAVRSWRFEPGRDASGKPVATLSTVEVTFRTM